MIRKIENLPDDVIGFEASGVITANDYETLVIPLIESKLIDQSKINILYQIGPGFKKFDLGAMWEDAKVGLKYMKAWKKVALVTDSMKLKYATKAFSIVMPAQVKIFSNKDLEKAKEWLSS